MGKAQTAILVLGAAVWPDGRPSPALARRTAEAAQQFHLGEEDIVVPCGGLGQNPPSEAEVMRALLVEAGVPDDAILLEDQSTSTAENIAFAKRILDPLSISNVLIVSDAYHLPRARLIAQRMGLRVSVAAAPLRGPRPSTFLRGALREIPAYIAAAIGWTQR